ncbi:hypothetical protein HZI30_10515 [Serratia fonticola]|uniref:hypothetical protein n=1 Tax=Serratia fonticola TaxID=47917 RepID=UPI0015C63C3A|nr:hypothetical protein [Serratia fonticola]NXZ87366.1 hypothetical protein [Serratia fonticola]
MQGFNLTNLLPPGMPNKFSINTNGILWDLEIIHHPNINDVIDKIKNGACANTYSMSTNIPSNQLRASGLMEESYFDLIMDNLLKACLAFSFINGTSVRPTSSTPYSKISILDPGDKFPRDHAIHSPESGLSIISEYVDFVELFCSNNNVFNTEKMLLIMHYYLDSVAAWSLENQYTLLTTILQIIADTEKTSGRQFAQNHAAQRGSKVGFYDYLAGAADRTGINQLTFDAVKLRNKLIHEGKFDKSTYPSISNITDLISESYSWIDSYIFKTVGAQCQPKQRHSSKTLEHFMNSFSYDI